MRKYSDTLSQTVSASNSVKIWYLPKIEKKKKTGINIKIKFHLSKQSRSRVNKYKRQKKKISWKM